MSDMPGVGGSTYECLLTLLSPWVLILEFGQVVDILVDNDPEIVSFVVRRNVAGRE